MKEKQRSGSIRLGKGLEALIQDTQPLEKRLKNEAAGAISFILVNRIRPNPYQPRQDFSQEALNELIASIKEKGLIQPITVRKVGENYEIIAGERRLRAAQAIGLEKIPAYLINVDSKEEMLEMAIIENVQREKLNPIELAQSYQRLIDECNLTQDQVAQKIGKDRSTVTNLIRLLKLEDYIKESIKIDQISMGHARALLSIEDSESRENLWNKTIKGSWSVRKLEKAVRVSVSHPTEYRKTTVKVNKTVHHRKIEEKFRDIFGTQVRIHPKKQGGAIEIEYYTPEDLDRLLEIINSIKY